MEAVLPMRYTSQMIFTTASVHVEEEEVTGLRIEALSANTGVITCLGNDTGYENIYSHQLEVKSQKDDLLIALSGSGNSANMVKAIKTANAIGVQTFAILHLQGENAKN